MKSYKTPLFNFYHLKTETPSSSDFHKHMHNGCEFLYFLNGEADFVINASTYHMKKRDFLLIHPGDYHYLIPTSPVPYERICMHFSESVIPKQFLSLLPKLKSVYHIHKHSTIDNIFSSLLSSNENNYATQDILFLIEQNIGVILTHLKYLQEESLVPSETNQLINDIIDYIDANIESNINIDVLSKKFFKSSSWIAHNFANTLKIPIQQYINNRKIVYGQALILNGAQPTKVASRLGFNNYSTFFKAYRKFLGKSPMEDLASTHKMQL